MGGWIGFRDVFEEAGILWGFIGILNNVNSAPIIA
jgi:hypothetical protein